MDSDACQPPLIDFDDVNEESKTSSSVQNEQYSSATSEERVSRSTVSASGGRGSQGYLGMDSTGQGEASGTERKAEQGKDLDANGMEDMIQKILEKYGEAEEQADSVTPGRTTAQDAAKSTGDAKRKADNSVNDMIRRESLKWDRVYGTEDNHTSGSTRDNHTSGSTRDWTGRQETGRRPVTSTQDVYNDHVEIGSVIRSQTGVAKQLTSVTKGLDEVNDDLEEMKMELKRIQTKAYTCLNGGDLLGGQSEEMKREFKRTLTNAYTSLDDGDYLGGQTAKEFAPIGGLRDAGSYRRKNEWIEEREGVVRFDNGISVPETERYWKAHQAPASYLPGAGRTHIKENDVHVANLLTIADPVNPYRQTRSLVDDGAVKRERHVDLDRFGRPITQFTSVEDSSSKHSDDHWRVKSSRSKPDGYCYMCEEFGDINTARKSVPPTYDDPSRVVRRSHNHTYNPVSIADLDQNSHHSRSRDEDLGIYKTPSGVYYYSDEVRRYPDEVTLDYDGTMRSLFRQSSVPRGFQSQSQSVVVQRPLSQSSYPDDVTLDYDGTTRSYVRQSSVPRGFQSQSQSVVVQRPLSQIHRSSAGFTSKFLTKVRRRNSLGGRIDTDRYRAQTLKGY